MTLSTLILSSISERAARIDIDKEFNDGATPLLGDADVAQLLCGARADIDKEFNDGAILLLVAS